MSTYTFLGIGLYLFPHEAALVDEHARALVAHLGGDPGETKPVLPLYDSATTLGVQREGRTVLYRDPAERQAVLGYHYGDSIALVALHRPEPPPDLAARSPDALAEAKAWRSWISAGAGAAKPYQNAFLHILEGYGPGAPGSTKLVAHVDAGALGAAASPALDRQTVIAAMMKLNSSQLNELALRLALPAKNLPGAEAASASHAIAIFNLADQQPDGLTKLPAGILQVAPHLVAALSSAGTPSPITFGLLSDGEYVVAGPEDDRALHAWLFDFARPFRLALFHGKALRYARELEAAVTLRRRLPRADLDVCEQKRKNVETAAHNFRAEWVAAGLGVISASPLGAHFDRILSGLVENARTFLEKLAAQAAPSAETAIPMPPALVPPPPLAYEPEQQLWHGPLPTVKALPAAELEKCRRRVEVLLVTVTETERDAVLRRMSPLPPRKSVGQGTSGPYTYYVGRFAKQSVALTMCRMGSIGSGSSKDAVRAGIDLWRPRAVIMVGIAFGKDSTKQGIADVLVASQIISYEEQRVGSRTEYRGPIGESTPLLIDRFRNALGWSFSRPDATSCKSRVGAILSGEELVDNVARRDALFAAFPQAIGGEMEGRGLYAAAQEASVAWILVKAICDWADGAKHKHHQPLAAAAAADLVYQVLSDPGALLALPKKAAQ